MSNEPNISDEEVFFQLIACISSGSDYTFNSAVVHEKLSQKKKAYTTSFLSALKEVLNSDEYPPSSKFYSLYLLVKATETKNDVLLLNLARQKEILNYLFKSAQFDRKKSIPERGQTFFTKEPSKEKAAVGHNFILMLLEAFKYWGQDFGPNDPSNPLSMYPNMYNTLLKQVSFPETFVYVGKEHELTDDFHLKPAETLGNENIRKSKLTEESKPTNSDLSPVPNKEKVNLLTESPENEAQQREAAARSAKDAEEGRVDFFACISSGSKYEENSRKVFEGVSRNSAAYNQGLLSAMARVLDAPTQPPVCKFYTLLLLVQNSENHNPAFMTQFAKDKQLLVKLAKDANTDYDKPHEERGRTFFTQDTSSSDSIVGKNYMTLLLEAIHYWNQSYDNAEKGTAFSRFKSLYASLSKITDFRDEYVIIGKTINAGNFKNNQSLSKIDLLERPKQAQQIASPPINEKQDAQSIPPELAGIVAGFSKLRESEEALKEVLDSNPIENPDMKEFTEYMVLEVNQTFKEKVEPHIEPLFTVSDPLGEKYLEQAFKEGEIVQKISAEQNKYKTKKIGYKDFRKNILELLNQIEQAAPQQNQGKQPEPEQPKPTSTPQKVEEKPKTTSKGPMGPKKDNETVGVIGIQKELAPGPQIISRVTSEDPKIPEDEGAFTNNPMAQNVLKRDMIGQNPVGIVSAKQSEKPKFAEEVKEGSSKPLRLNDEDDGGIDIGRGYAPKEIGGGMMGKKLNMSPVPKSQISQEKPKPEATPKVNNLPDDDNAGGIDLGRGYAPKEIGGGMMGKKLNMSPVPSVQEKPKPEAITKVNDDDNAGGIDLGRGYAPKEIGGGMMGKKLNMSPTPKPQMSQEKPKIESIKPNKLPDDDNIGEIDFGKGYTPKEIGGGMMGKKLNMSPVPNLQEKPKAPVKPNMLLDDDNAGEVDFGYTPKEIGGGMMGKKQNMSPVPKPQMSQEKPKIESIKPNKLPDDDNMGEIDFGKGYTPKEIGGGMMGKKLNMSPVPMSQEKTKSPERAAERFTAPGGERDTREAPQVVGRATVGESRGPKKPTIMGSDMLPLSHKAPVKPTENELNEIIARQNKLDQEREERDKQKAREKQQSPERGNEPEGMKSKKVFAAGAAQEEEEQMVSRPREISKTSKQYLLETRLKWLSHYRFKAGDLLEDYDELPPVKQTLNAQELEDEPNTPRMVTEEDDYAIESKQENLQRVPAHSVKGRAPIVVEEKKSEPQFEAQEEERLMTNESLPLRSPQNQFMRNSMTGSLRKNSGRNLTSDLAEIERGIKTSSAKVKAADLVKIEGSIKNSLAMSGKKMQSSQSLQDYAEKEEMMKEISKLKQENTKLQRDNVNLKSDASKTSFEQSQTDDKLTILHLKALLGNYESQITSLREELSYVKDENFKLSQDMSLAAESRSSAGHLVGENRNLKAQVRDLQEEINGLRRDGSGASLSSQKDLRSHLLNAPQTTKSGYNLMNPQKSSPRPSELEQFDNQFTIESDRRGKGHTVRTANFPDPGEEGGEQRNDNQRGSNRPVQKRTIFEQVGYDKPSLLLEYEGDSQQKNSYSRSSYNQGSSINYRQSAEDPSRRQQQMMYSSETRQSPQEDFSKKYFSAQGESAISYASQSRDSHERPERRSNRKDMYQINEEKGKSDDSELELKVIISSRKTNKQKEVKGIEVKPYSGLLERLKDSVSSSETANDLLLYRMACLKNKSTLYSDDKIQVGIISSVVRDQGGKRNLLKLVLYYGNKTRQPISNFSSTVSSAFNITKLVKPERLETLLDTERQIKQQVVLSFKAAPFEALSVELSFTAGRERFEFLVFLPSVITKFMDFKYIDAEEFRGMWKASTKNILKTGAIDLDPAVVKSAYDFKKYFGNLVDLAPMNEYDFVQGKKVMKLAGLFELEKTGVEYLLKINLLPGNKVIFQVSSFEDHGEVPAFLLQTLQFLFQQQKS